MENGVIMQYFEWNLPNDGNLWKQLKADASHLHDIGVTAVWIPPAYKADEQQDEGYAIYDLYDLGEFDQKSTIRTKYGTKDELKAMIGELHKYHISVYLDVVLNHKAGGDFTEKFMVVEVDPQNRTEPISEQFEVQGWTGYLFHGRNNKYSDFKWHWYHFSGTGFDDAKRRSGIFQIVGEGKFWSEGVDKENGNYDFLLANDIDLDHPEVVTELNRWGKWVSNELNLDGMRLDAIKHMKDQFIKQFLETIRAERGENFYAVGEYWNGDLETLDNYLESVGNKVNLFDVPLHYNLFQASQVGKEYDLQNILKNTLVEHHPELAVTFVDNHDSQQGSSLESQIEDWFKPLAYGLILLMKDGYPCLFYGDYYGVKGEKSPHTLIIDILLDARRKYAYGEQVNYFDDPSIAGFIRKGDDEHTGSGLVFLMSNDVQGAKVMSLGKERGGEIWYELTGSIKENVVIDKEGNGTFSVNGRNLAVWIKEKAG
ncbi:alpha-amylase [Parabacteroides segnis]|uniref:alpha-amylase n=1 Tax=Parabacteroides segnis TaxID=2763058 RepID=UPI00351728DD